MEIGHSLTTLHEVHNNSAPPEQLLAVRGTEKRRRQLSRPQHLPES